MIKTASRRTKVKHHQLGLRHPGGEEEEEDEGKRIILWYGGLGLGTTRYGEWSMFNAWFIQ